MTLNQAMQLEGAKMLIFEISSYGYQAFIVGGAVRDLIMGQTPKDVDIATNAPIEFLEMIWPYG